MRHVGVEVADIPGLTSIAKSGTDKRPMLDYLVSLSTCVSILEISFNLKLGSTSGKSPALNRPASLRALRNVWWYRRWELDVEWTRYAAACRGFNNLTKTGTKLAQC